MAYLYPGDRFLDAQEFRARYSHGGGNPGGDLGMNLINTHRLMGGAARQNQYFPVESDRKELQRMAETNLGRTLLRVFSTGIPRVAPPTAEKKRTVREERTDSCATTLSKWRDKFVIMQMKDAA